MSTGIASIGTKFPEFFAALMEPIPPNQLRHRTQAGARLDYITSRTAMIRLDEVVGPEAWTFDIKPWGNDALIGTLTITLPDGTKAHKSDVGAKAAMKEADNDAKSAASDCFKRCAAMWGIGRELYASGAPEFADEHGEMIRQPPAQPAPARNGSGHQPPRQEERQAPRQVGNVPRSGRALYAWARDQGQKANLNLVAQLQAWGNQAGHPDKMVDWDAETVAEAHAFIGPKIDGHDQGDAYEG